MKILNLPLSEIRPYWRNPRDNEAAVDAVAQSIEEYGFNSPIILDTENVIIAGHTRYKAAQRIGLDKVPCVIADLPAAKAQAYRIADNKTSELAEWDMDKLIPELRELDVEEMQVFFGDESLEELVQESVGMEIKVPTTEKVQAAQTKLENTFTTRNEQAQGDYVEVTCSCCGQDFFVSKSEIARMPGKPLE